jgi:hypothetical protein
VPGLKAGVFYILEKNPDAFAIALKETYGGSPTIQKQKEKKDK